MELPPTPDISRWARTPDGLMLELKEPTGRVMPVVMLVLEVLLALVGLGLVLTSLGDLMQGQTVKHVSRYGRPQDMSVILTLIVGMFITAGGAAAVLFSRRRERFRTSRILLRPESVVVERGGSRFRFPWTEIRGVWPRPDGAWELGLTRSPVEYLEPPGQLKVAAQPPRPGYRLGSAPGFIAADAALLQQALGDPSMRAGLL